ncbi:hypothetical protein EVAR_2762_1 [Eumeta japonica]|uniref:Uncharacterized protein n=1 Tax=Eumeta variegata TaxID=151549 RepID=A0A4C1T2F3_EUMVA|nr:hypothetical protein EVAR_2762_1 [Eumeta japonica]
MSQWHKGRKVMTSNTNAGEKKEGSGSVDPAHCTIRKQFRAAEFPTVCTPLSFFYIKSCSFDHNMLSILLLRATMKLGLGEALGHGTHWGPLAWTRCGLLRPNAMNSKYYDQYTKRVY